MDFNKTGYLGYHDMMDLLKGSFFIYFRIWIWNFLELQRENI